MVPLGEGGSGGGGGGGWEWEWREGGDRKRDSWHAIVLQLRG